MPRPTAAASFQDMILSLQHYWSAQGCVILQPYDMEMGAGTFHPATFLRSLGPRPWRAAYVQPCRRPSDGRYGDNPNRFQHYYQFQTILKPAPQDIQALYLASLQELGIDPQAHDIRFVEDDWESPTLGAWGLGWEVQCDGMEISQFTYFQQMGGIECRPVSGELTYGLERLAMFLQQKPTGFALDYGRAHSRAAAPLTYADVFLQNEREQSAYNFDAANTDMLLRHFRDYQAECRALVARRLVLPAYDHCIKASHCFNLLEARKVLSVPQRQSSIAEIRALARACAELWLAQEQA